jgi:hypothetical protein
MTKRSRITVLVLAVSTAFVLISQASQSAVKRVPSVEDLMAP